MKRLAIALAIAAVTVPLLATAAGGAEPLTISDGPQGVTSDARPTFAFRTPGGAEATCLVDGATVGVCASPFRIAALGDGPHVFEVRAAGESAFRTFTVDTEPPELTLDGPSDSAESAAAYAFSSEGGAELACWVDDRAPEPCTSPWTTPDLPNGTHGVYVRATDAAGNATERGAVVTFSAEPPDTVIEAGPSGSTKERSPRFGLRSSKPRSTFDCRLDEADWAACDPGYNAPELSPGPHRFEARARDAGGNVDASPATSEFTVIECQTTVTIGALEAASECFARDGDWLVADGPVKLNGITFNPLAGRPLRLDPTARRVSFGRIQLRIGPIVLYQGELEWTVPEGDSVTLAHIDLDTHSRTDGPDPTEADLELTGDDDANVGGFPLKGEAELKLERGASVLTATIELPKLFTDAEGHGLTGTVALRADNQRGLRLDSVSVTAPLAMIGRLEVHNLFVRFAGDGNGDASPTCNAASPGLRWEGGADAIVLPTPNRLQLNDVGVGFADGAFSYARASWIPGDPGHDFGGGVKVQRIAFSLCAGPPVRLEGRIGLTAMDGALRIPDAGLIFTGGDPWTLRAEAPAAELRRDRTYAFKDLFLEYRSTGAVSFGGHVQFGLGLKGSVPAGGLDAAVQVDAEAKGFIDGSRFNADLSARGCFGGTFTVAGAVPIAFNDVCPHVDGVVSSTGVAVCGVLTVGGRDLGSVGAGYRWGGTVEFMARACDVGPWRVTATASAAAAGERTVTLSGGQRGVLVALRGADGPPSAVLHGPRGEVVRTPGDAREVVRTTRAFAFTNLATRTTYVVLSRPAGGRWRIVPEGGARLTDVRAAGLLAPPAVSAQVDGRGRTRVLRYRVGTRRGQHVVFYERGRGLAHRIGAADGSRGTLRFSVADGAGGVRRIEALVEQDGLPRRRVTVATYRAPARLKPGRPPALRIERRRNAIRVVWGRAAHSDRYGIRVATSDGQRRFFLREGGERIVHIAGVKRGRRVSARVVGLRPDNAAGPAATRSSK
jgi:hypothetical protein